MKRRGIWIIALVLALSIGVIAWLQYERDMSPSIWREALDGGIATRPPAMQAPEGLSRVQARAHTENEKLGYIHGRVVLGVGVEDQFSLGSQGTLILAPGSEVGEQGGQEEPSIYAFDQESGALVLAAVQAAVNVPVENGLWRIARPTENMFVLGYAEPDQQLDLVSKTWIVKDATEEVLVQVEPARMLELSVTDQITGTEIAEFSVSETMAIPTERHVTIRLKNLAKKQPAATLNHAGNGVVEFPGEPSDAKPIVSGVKGLVRFPRVPYERKLWIKAEGYQDEWIQVGTKVDTAKVDMRPKGSLHVSIRAPGWHSRSTNLRIVRGGKGMGVYPLDQDEKEFHFEGVGAGDYRIALESKFKVTDQIIWSDVAAVAPGSETQLHVEVPSMGGASLGSLKIVLDLSNVGGVNPGLFGIRVASAHEPVRQLIGATAIPLTSIPIVDGRGVAEIRDLQAGQYRVMAFPSGLVYQVLVEPGKQTTLEAEIPARAIINLRLVDETGSAVAKPVDVHPAWIFGDSTAYPRDVLALTNGVLSNSKAWGWRIEAIPGILDIVLVDASGSIRASRAGTRIEAGEQEVELVISQVKPRTVIAIIEDVFPVSGFDALGSALLSLTNLDSGAESFPVLTKTSPFSDVTQTVQATFLLPSEGNVMGTTLQVNFGDRQMHKISDEWSQVEEARILRYRIVE